MSTPGRRHVRGRHILAVATRIQARTEGLDGLKLPMEELPDTMGRRFASGMAGTTEVPGVWVAGNATELTAQVGASAAADALAATHVNALPSPMTPTRPSPQHRAPPPPDVRGPHPPPIHSATGPPALILHALFERNP
ncbi:hypothetical protein [Streptomyces sp. NBC_00842]|uniref:hypothetical protein n=1 Tax=unclassified Streptomyces TaxID=2593676 RepID=UPI00386EA9F2